MTYCGICNHGYKSKKSLSNHFRWCSGRMKKGLCARGWKLSSKTKRVMSLSKQGKNNPMWKGDKVGYLSLHEWIRSHKPLSLKCDYCGYKKKLDLANISQKYKRNIKDWEWLCRLCHMRKDGRLKNRNKEGRFQSAVLS